MTRRVAVSLGLASVAIALTVLLVRLRSSELTFSFSRDEIQQRLNKEFPLEQKLLNYVTISYSDPVVKLDEGSDRVGLALNVRSKVFDGQLFKGRVAADWTVRYDPAERAVFFVDPFVSKFEFEGIPKSTQGMVTKLATPALSEYLRKVPVYRFKPGDLRLDPFRYGLKFVTVKNGRLRVVVEPTN